MLPLVHQYIGSLIGQCLGDALGFLVEGYPPPSCYEYVSELRAGRAGQRGRDPYPFGQYTDDSQLARELLHSYALLGRFSPEDYANRIAVLFDDERIVGRGRATEEAARRLIKGVPWHQAGTPPPAAGNGSAMRAGPVGLMCYDDSKELIRIAHDQGRITHQDPRCSAGAVAIAGGVALALRGGTLDIEEFCQQLALWVGVIDLATAASIQKLPAWVKESPEKAVEAISKEGLDPGYQDFWQGISPFVTGSVLWSLYSFLRSPDDYWEAICIAIQPGGDVDTTAAMTGAVSGARLGYEAIPRSLACKINDQGVWDFDSLKALARQAYAVKHP